MLMVTDAVQNRGDWRVSDEYGGICSTNARKWHVLRQDGVMGLASQQVLGSKLERGCTYVFT